MGSTARSSPGFRQVSDSEISRILQGKSRPGLDNAFRLAKAVNVTLDYLADDSLDAEPPQPADHLTPEERRLLTIAQKIGYSEVLTLLENIRFLGYEVAMSRLVGGKPVIEIEKEVGEIAAGRRRGGVDRARLARPRASSASA